MAYTEAQIAALETAAQRFAEQHNGVLFYQESPMRTNTDPLHIRVGKWLSAESSKAYSAGTQKQKEAAIRSVDAVRERWEFMRDAALASVPQE